MLLYPGWTFLGLFGTTLAAHGTVVFQCHSGQPILVLASGLQIVWENAKLYHIGAFIGTFYFGSNHHSKKGSLDYTLTVAFDHVHKNVWQFFLLTSAVQDTPEEDVDIANKANDPDGRFNWPMNKVHPHCPIGLLHHHSVQGYIQAHHPIQHYLVLLHSNPRCKSAYHTLGGSAARIC